MTINAQELNGLSLAYIGDSIYEIYVRKHLLALGYRKVNDLQRHSKSYVSAKAHAALFKLMEAEQLLSEEEMVYFKRGRNTNSHTKAKNTDVVTYRISTGMESLFGYLYLTEQNERINELMTWIYQAVEGERISHGK